MPRNPKRDRMEILMMQHGYSRDAALYAAEQGPKKMHELDNSTKAELQEKINRLGLGDKVEGTGARGRVVKDDLIQVLHPDV